MQLRALGREVGPPRVDPLGLRAADLSARTACHKDDRRVLRPELRRSKGALVAREVLKQRAARRREGGFHHGGKRAGGEAEDGVRQVPGAEELWHPDGPTLRSRSGSLHRRGLLAAVRSHTAQLYGAVLTAAMRGVIASVIKTLEKLIASYGRCRSLSLLKIFKAFCSYSVLTPATSATRLRP